MIENLSVLLSRCKRFRVGTEILIITDTDSTLVQLLKKQHELINSLIESGEHWEKITLRAEMGEYKSTLYYPKLKPPVIVQAMTNARTTTEAEIIHEIMKHPHPSSLVRMEDDKGIFANSRISESSGINANNWLGANMSSYWIPEELQRYKTLLLQDRELRNYTYTAYLFTGEAAKFTVDAQLVKFNNDLCRWVRVLDCELIS
jgi:PAS domain-containing protein